MRHGSKLQPPAIAAYTRNELATALRSRNPYNVNLLLGGVITPPPTTPSSINPSEPATSTVTPETNAPSAGAADPARQQESQAVTSPEPGKQQAKPKLYWMDYLATLAEVPYAAHGYAQYYCLSILDKHHHPDITLEQGMKILSMCAMELRRRMPIDYKGLNVKVVDIDGVREVEFADDANIKGA